MAIQAAYMIERCQTDLSLVLCEVGVARGLGQGMLPSPSWHTPQSSVNAFVSVNCRALLEAYTRRRSRL